MTGDGTYFLYSNVASGPYIEQVYAYYGGFAYVEQGATVELKTEVRQQFCEAYEGVAFYAVDRARVVMRDGITFQSNKNKKRALFVLLEGSQFWIKDTTVRITNTIYDSAVFYLDNNQQQYHYLDGSIRGGYGDDFELWSYLEESSIERSTVEEGGRLMTILDSNVKMTSMTFNLENGQIKTDTAGIHMAYSKVEILDCAFLGPRRQDLYTRVASLTIKEMNGAFIAAYQYSNLKIRGATTFTGGRGTLGGCILLLGLSEADIEGASFSLCAAMYGGAIYAEGHRALKVTLSQFADNIAYQGYGENIYSSKATASLEIADSAFSSYHNSIYTTGYQFTFRGNTVLGSGQDPKVSSLPFRVDGGGVYIEQTSRVDISTNNIFKDLTGRTGGCLYIKQDRNSVTAQESTAGAYADSGITISGGTFTNCQAEFNGGAIYLENPLDAKIGPSVVFESNAAADEGGALYYNCDPSEADWEVATSDKVEPCILGLSFTDFNENSATIGGAIRWNLLEMTVDGGYESNYTQLDTGTNTYGSLKFTNNQANIYGPDIAGLARELVKFDNAT